MAAAGSQTLGVFGFVKLGSTQVLTRTGATLQHPRNLDEPDPINGGGGYGPVNIGNGVMFPVVNIPAVALDAGVAGWFTAANMNAWFQTRSARPIWDLTELSTLIFSANGSIGNGRGSWIVNKPKGMGFSINARKGQEIGLNLRFCGRNRQKALVGDLPPATSTLTGDPLMFDRLVLGTALDGKGLTALSLNYDTRTTPNMELDGSIYPVEHNAGTPVARLTLEMNSLDTIAPPGYDATNDTWITLTDVVFSIVYDSTTPTSITFTMGRVECITPFDVTTMGQRVSRSLQYNVYGKVNAFPVVIA